MAGSWSSFVTLYGEDPNPSWVHGLRNFTESEIMSGYARAVSEPREFPPNLSEFVAMCGGSADWESKRLHKPFDPDAEIVDRSESALLPPPKDDRSPAEILAEMRSTVGLS